MDSQERSIFVAQKGARDRYLWPRAVKRTGHDLRLFTDWYANSRSPATLLSHNFAPRAVRSFLAHHAPDIPMACVETLNPFQKATQATLRYWARRVDKSAFHPLEDRMFAKAASRSLVRGSYGLFVGYAYASLEALQAAKRMGIGTILLQMDPGLGEHELVAAERAKHPSWSFGPESQIDDHYRCNVKEWALADTIVVNSEWSRELIVRHGAPSQRIQVVPLAYDAPRGGHDLSGRTQNPRPLQLLWLGTASQRKGIRNAIEAMQAMEPGSSELHIVGRREVDLGKIHRPSINCYYHGPCAPSEITTWLNNADYLVLPTLSDGFALTQLEALAHGRPLIVSRNCANIITDGVHGFTVDAGSTKSLLAGLRLAVAQGPPSMDVRERCLALASKYTFEKFCSNAAALLANATNSLTGA